MTRQHAIQELAEDVLQRRERAVREITLFQPQERQVRVHAVPCESADDRGPAVVLVIQDMTESNRYEQLRKEFVANVSHELKSPLTSIKSLTETLLDGALEDPPAGRRFVQMIESDVERLSRLIDDLLALSQIESQATPLRLAPVEMRRLVDSVVASLAPATERQRLRVDIAISEHLTIQADPDRLRQGLINLIENAIKYNTAGGAIRINARIEQDAARIIVADTGIGIPIEDQPRIFERFYRVDKARSRELGGTGLGLSIVKHVVEAHGGQVSVESRPNEGATFTVILPQSRS